MSDTASSPIHISSISSFSDEEWEELLAQQPSTSSAVRDDSHGQPNAEESPLQVSEIPGSPRRPDELNEQPQRSPAKKQRITAYALDMESLPHDLKEFLQAVRRYFTQSVNLEREKAAVSMSTFSKCQERMLCKWRFLFYVGAFLLFLQFVRSLSFGSGFEFLRVSPCIFSLFESIFRYFPGFLGYCKTTLGSEETLNADCFLRTGLLEGYVDFLRVSFSRHFKSILTSGVFPQAARPARPKTKH